jgi:hypothetical protein
MTGGGGDVFADALWATPREQLFDRLLWQRATTAISLKIDPTLHTPHINSVSARHHGVASAAAARVAAQIVAARRVVIVVVVLAARTGGAHKQLLRSVGRFPDTVPQLSSQRNRQARHRRAEGGSSGERPSAGRGRRTAEVLDMLQRRDRGRRDDIRVALAVHVFAGGA